MATLLTCDDIEMSTEELLRSLFIILDDGSTAIRYVTTTGGDPIDCDLTEYPTLAMLRGAIVREGDVLAIQIQEAS